MKSSHRSLLSGLGFVFLVALGASVACSKNEPPGDGDGDGDIDSGDGGTGDGDIGDGDGDEGGNECYSLVIHSRPAGPDGEFAPLASGIALIDSPAVVLTSDGLGLIAEHRETPDGYLVEETGLVEESDLESLAVRIFDASETIERDLDGDGSADTLTRDASDPPGTPVRLIVTAGTLGMGGGAPTLPESAEYDLARNPVAGADIGDINGDGYLDYVYSSVAGIDVLPGLEGGTFGARQHLVDGDHLEFDFVVGDVDADGVDEIVVVSELRMTTWDSTDGETFTPTTEELGVFVESIGFSPQGHPSGPALLVVAQAPASGTIPDCAFQCATSDDCDGTDSCSFGSCGECTAHSDCDGGFCRAGTCTECLEDSHCVSDGQVCSSGTCESALSEFSGYTQIDVGTVFCGLRDGRLTCQGFSGVDYERDDLGPYTKVSVSHWEEGVVCMLRVDGTIECIQGPYHTPNPVLDDIPPGPFVDLDVGFFHACALDEAGEITCWGDAEAGQLQAPSGSFTQLALGHRHSCALSTTGAIECWGCQDDTCDENQATPPSGSDFTVVTATYYRTCAVREGGTATCWGEFNGFPTPTGTWSSLSCGNQQCCGNDGETDAVRCFGFEADWAPVESLHGLSTYSDYACGLRDDGTIQCSHRLPYHF